MIHMHDHAHHDELMDAIAGDYQDILQNSEQGVYMYLSDEHKVCNEKFAEMLGYASPEEWAEVTTPFPQTFVADDSQETLVDAYQNAMDNMVGSVNSITWKKKDGSTVDSEVILVPIVHSDHLIALHFVTSN